MRKYLAGLVVVLMPLAGLAAQDGVALCPPETIPAAPAPGPPPPASIRLGLRHGHAFPSNCGHSHTGAGNIDVAQPSPDTVVVTMTGVAVQFALLNGGPVVR